VQHSDGVEFNGTKGVIKIAIDTNNNLLECQKLNVVPFFLQVVKYGA
jgi:hypothetical protein